LNGELGKMKTTEWRKWNGSAAIGMAGEHLARTKGLGPNGDLFGPRAIAPEERHQPFNFRGFLRAFHDSGNRFEH
jgi:hypothetical protein